MNSSELTGSDSSTWPRRSYADGPLVATPEERAAYLQGKLQWEQAFGARPHAEHMVELFTRREKSSAGSIDPERLSEYVVQALVGRGAFWYGHHAAYTYDQAARLQQVRQPALILTNTRAPVSRAEQCLRGQGREYRQSLRCCA